MEQQLHRALSHQMREGFGVPQKTGDLVHRAKRGGLGRSPMTISGPRESSAFVGMGHQFESG